MFADKMRTLIMSAHENGIYLDNADIKDLVGKRLQNIQLFGFNLVSLTTMGSLGWWTRSKRHALVANCDISDDDGSDHFIHQEYGRANAMNIRDVPTI